MSKKEKFPLYLSPEKKAILERRYQEDGSRSITAFIERAVDFYLDYLSANNAGLFLPTSIKSYHGRKDGTAGGAAVLHRLPAGGGAGHGSRYPRRRVSVQRRGSAPTAGGERSKCAEKPMAASRWRSGCGDAWEEDDEWQD